MLRLGRGLNVHSSPAGFLAGRADPQRPSSSSRGFVTQAASEQPPGGTGYLALRPPAGWPAEHPDGTSRPGEQPKIAPREDGASAGTEMERRIGSTGLAAPLALALTGKQPCHALICEYDGTAPANQPSPEAYRTAEGLPRRARCGSKPSCCSCSVSGISSLRWRWRASSSP